MVGRLKATGIFLLVLVFLALTFPVFVIAGILDGIVEWWKFPSAVIDFGRELKLF